MDRQDLTLKRLREVLHYEPATGKFTWIRQIGKRARPGQVAGTVDFGGYTVVTIDRRRHKAHRLAWLYIHGVWPPVAIDHVNGIRTDNRLENLRLADWSENQQNRGRQVNNRSGYMGVSWDAHAGKWRAGIRFDGRARNLGNFDSPEMASAAYLKAKAQFHPYQPRPRDS